MQGEQLQNGVVECEVIEMATSGPSTGVKPIHLDLWDTWAASKDA